MITPNQPISCVPSLATNKAPVDALTNNGYYVASANVTRFAYPEGFVLVDFTGSGPRYLTVNYGVNPATTCRNSVLRIQISDFTKTGNDVLYIYGYNGVEIHDNGVYIIPIATSVFNFELAGSTIASFRIISVQVFCVSEIDGCDNCKTGEYQQPIFIEYNGSGWVSESLSFQAPALRFKNLVYSICEGGPEWDLGNDDWGNIDAFPPPCSIDLNYCYATTGVRNSYVNGDFSSSLINGKTYRISYTLEEIEGEFCGLVNSLQVYTPSPIITITTTDAVCPGEYVYYFTYSGTSYVAGQSIHFTVTTNADGKIKMRISNVRVDELGGYTLTLLPSNLIWSNPSFLASHYMQTYIDSESFYGDTFFSTFHFVSNHPNTGFNKDDCFRLIITQDTYDPNFGGDDWYCLSEEYKWVTDTCNTVRVMATQDVTNAEGVCAFGFDYKPTPA